MQALSNPPTSECLLAQSLCLAPLLFRIDMANRGLERRSVRLVQLCHTIHKMLISFASEFHDPGSQVESAC